MKKIYYGSKAAILSLIFVMVMLSSNVGFTKDLIYVVESPELKSSVFDESRQEALDLRPQLYIDLIKYESGYDNDTREIFHDYASGKPHILKVNPSAVRYLKLQGIAFQEISLNGSLEFPEVKQKLPDRMTVIF